MLLLLRKVNNFQPLKLSHHDHHQGCDGRRVVVVGRRVVVGFGRRVVVGFGVVVVVVVVVFVVVVGRRVVVVVVVGLLLLSLALLSIKT